MKIYLVQPVKNSSDDLAKENLSLQALVRRMILEELKFNRIYVNNSDVSIKTGDFLSKALRVPLLRDDRFSDIGKNVILGKLDNMDLENLENVNLFIEEIISFNKDLIVTIGSGIHRLIISKLTGMPLLETRHFDFENAGFSVLYYDNGTNMWRINSINDVNHLRIP